MGIYLSGHFIYMVLGNISMTGFSIFICCLASCSYKYSLICNVPFVMTFWSFFLENLQTFCISKGVNIFTFQIFMFFILLIFHKECHPIVAGSYLIKAYTLPQKQVCLSHKTRIMLDWTIWNCYFCRWKCQILHFRVAYHN